MGIQERKEREKEQRREEILDAAEKVFFEKGLNVATMDEIAEKAELSKGTLYLYYKSKEDLYLAVIMRGLEILHEMFKVRASTTDSTATKLVALWDAYLAFFNNHREHFRMIHFLQSPHFHKQVSEEMKQSCTLLNRRIWDTVNAIFRRGVEEEILRPNLNPVDVGIILWSSATALMLRVDNEYALWKESMGIDLLKTLKLSNELFFDAICTPQGRTMIAAVEHR
ncbi:MAG TPA: TetR/AcrR family transcriptional regulator [Bacteroidota bacterium]|nr:TetR/AcrR family transcriptional regulator [Bacteroidota bacterium]